MVFGLAPIKEQLERISELPLPLRVLASPKTTAVLGGTLAALTAPITAPFLARQAVVATPKVIGGVARQPLKAAGLTLAAPVVVGAAISAPSAVKAFFDPTARFKLGQEIGAIIEAPKEKIPEILERTKDVLAKTPKVAAGAAGAAAVVAAAPVVVGKAKKFREERALQQQLSQPPLAAQTQLEAIPTPIGAKQPTPEATPTPSQPIDIDIDISNKPPKNEIFINNIIQSI
tara:strand:+ start:614 stop:1306 length:693 start_codon:yes stop_codon:yes gene_type:complete